MKIKIYLYIGLFLCISTSLLASSIPLDQFGGLDTDSDPTYVKEGRSQDSQNVSTDEFQGLTPRKGFVRFSTQTSDELWTFSPSNGVNYIITRSSHILKANFGDGVFVLTVGTVNPDVHTSGTQLGDRWYFTNITDGLKYWDTNTTSVASTTIKFSQLVTWKGRLWGAGLSGQERVIWGSRFNDGTFWNLVTDPAETDPVQITVSGRLDESVTVLYSSFRDKMIWMKRNSFGHISGSRRSNFSPYTISDTIGSDQPETVQDCNGELRFLGSQETIWGFDGLNLYELSKYKDGGGIRSLLETTVQSNASTKLWLQTTKSDWDQGVNGIRIQTDVSPGNVVLVSTTFSEL